MKYKILRFFRPISKEQFKKDLWPLIVVLLLINGIAISLFNPLDMAIHWNIALFLLNFPIGIYIGTRIIKRVLYFIDGKNRLSKAVAILLVGQMLPLYQIYLLVKCMQSIPKKSSHLKTLMLKPVSYCLTMLVITLAISFPHVPRHISLQLGPEASYITYITMDAYRSFKAKGEFSEECIKSASPDCFREKIKSEVLPGTSTSIILSVSIDMLILFKRKSALISQNETQKKEQTFKIAKEMLESNAFYLKENACNRITPLQLAGPVNLSLGMGSAYVLQAIDSHISTRFYKMASLRMRSILKKLKKYNKSKEQARNIASLDEFFEKDLGKICLQ
ncbi:MAG: hypothetical protein K9K67_08160 [Bacteriovoracaceae bacterium]|nr:hypothetical protein [Bacteriovoracaceae bacterium]